MKSTRGRLAGGCKVAVLAIAFIALSGTGYAQSLTATPTSLSFGNVPINMTSDSQSVTFTNVGPASFTFTTTPAVSGLTASEFSIVPLPTGCTAGVVLTINTSCAVNVTFTPTAIGTATATLSVPGAVGLNGVPLDVTLSGTGMSPPIVVDANTVPCRNYIPHYTDIQTAINNAPPGATVVVCPGTYAQQIVIKKSLTLRGVTNTAANTGAAVITSPLGGLSVSNAFHPFGGTTPLAVQVLVQASNVNIVDITVDGTGAFTGCSSPSLAGVGFDTGSSGTLKRVAVRNQNIPDGSGGYCGTNFVPPFGIGVLGQTAGRLTIQDSSVRGFASFGFDNFGASVAATSIVIKTTSFVSVGGKAASFCVTANAATAQLSNNTLTNCAVGMALGSQNSVTGNTVTNVVYGMVCEFLPCYGGNISGNTVAGADAAISGPGFTGTTFQNNDISGAIVGFDLRNTFGNTVTNNTINDAPYGIAFYLGSGQNISNNTFLNVTTLISNSEP